MRLTESIDTLGNIFEDLLDTKDRKSTGTYYTPPEIVSHMCRESLVYYLANKIKVPFDDMWTFLQYGEWLRSEDCPLREIDNALEKVRIFDPAVGSGAFVLGILNEIVKVRMHITECLTRALPAENEQEGHLPKINRHPYILKYNTIKNCIFSADIESRVVEITRRRLWLSLAGDYEMDIGLPCLPALSEFTCNIKCCDSLLDELEWEEQSIESAETIKDRGGFDIVIGNPPYISAVEGSKNDKTIRGVLRKKYPLLKGAFDIYAAFLLEGIYKTNNSGVYCWIVPNKLLVSEYAVPVLDFLKQNGLLYSVSVSNIEVFAKVGVYPIIVMGNKMGFKNVQYTQYSADTIEDLKNRNFRVKTSLKAYKTFADFNIKFASGATGFQAKLLSSHITEQRTDDSIPFIVSGSVDKYSVKYSRVRYMGSTYSKAYISKGDDIANSKWSLWCNEKIVIAGLTKELEAVYCQEPVALGVGAYAIYDFAGFDPKFLLGLLNSKFLSWYLNVKFSEKHLAGGYLAINKSTLEQLPLVKADTKIQSRIARITDEIQNNCKDTCIGGIDCVEAKRSMVMIDKLVYELFGLTGEEIEEVERFSLFL